MAVLDSGKSAITGGRKEILLERRLITEKGGIKERNRAQKAKNTNEEYCNQDFNENNSNDAADIKASYVHNEKEKQGLDARKLAQTPFSICFSPDSVIHSEVQYSETEELQCISSFRHYKDLFNFQNFPDKTINTLQEIKRTKVKSQLKNNVESLHKNKEIEKKNMLNQKTAKEANLKEDIFNKDIFLLLSTMQNNAGSANVTKDTRLLSETFFPSSEKYFSECIIEPLFQDQKTCDENFDKPHKTSELQPSLQRSTKQYKSVKRVFLSRKQFINKIKHLNLKSLDESTTVIRYTDVMKKTEISEPLVCLYSEKYGNNDIKENVIDSHKENESVEVKNMLPGTVKIFSISYNEDYPLNKSITKESMNQFSQKRAKVQIHVSKQSLQLTIDNQQDSKKMRTIEKYPNHLKQQGLSPFTAGPELLRCEKEFYGHVTHNLNFVTHSVEKKYFQDPQIQIGERSNEVNSSETIEEYSDSAQNCDVSLVAKTIDNYAPQEQTTLHYPDSHTFSKKSMYLLPMCESLIYSKEGKNELKSEQKILASHVEKDKSIITGTRPERKHINQVDYTTKIHLTPNLENEEFKILTQHEEKDGILNIGDTKPEFQQEIVPPMLSGLVVISQKKTKRSLVTDYNNLLLKKHGLADTFASEHLVQHLDIQREGSKSNLSINPSKFSSDEIPHHLESINHIMDLTPMCPKGSLNAGHLVVDPDNEIFIQNKTVCFKNLNYVDKLFIYGHEKVKLETGQEDKNSKKNIVHRKKNGRNFNIGQSVISNIFDETSYYFGKIYKKTNNDDFTKHKINKNIKAERHKAKHAHEQTKCECQDVNAFYYFNKVMQWKKSVTADSENGNRNTDRLQILERKSVFQNAIQNGKLIANIGLDWKDASSSLRVQEFNLKLVEESRKILQANICVDKLQQLQQEFEKLQYNISISSCEDIYKKRKQATTLVEHKHKLNIGHKKCMKSKMHLLPEVQGLMWDIRNNCGSQETESGTRPLFQ